MDKKIATKFLLKVNEIANDSDFEPAKYIELKIDNSNEGKAIFDEYYKKHKCCPSCGSKMLSCTLLGMISFQMNINNPNSYKDTNNAICENCGWEGTIDDLTEEKK